MTRNLIQMKINKNSFWLWLLLTIFAVIPIYLEPDFYQNILFYPRELSDIILGSILILTTPYTIASVVKLKLELKTLLPKTLLLISVFSFTINTILFSLFIVALNKIDSPAVNLLDISDISILIKNIALMIVCLMPFLLSPLLISKKRIVIGPWWSVLLIIFCAVTLQVIIQLLAGRNMTALVADFAQELGGHYYTWLNFVPIAIVVMSVIAAGVRLGKCWAVKYN